MTSRAAVILPAADLPSDIAAMEAADFALMAIFPADEPRRAELSGHGLSVVLDTQVATVPVTIEISGVEPFELSSGVRFVGPQRDAATTQRDAATTQRDAATTQRHAAIKQRDAATQQHGDAFVHTRGGDFGTGRAGMEYRDLLPDRHGGRVIGSHIRVPGSGPVPDYVHFHDISFQMIWCLSGRVKLVYEDQGDPFWMEVGDCVVQPPGIRHRVLHSEDDLEVVEVALPAEHRTTIDHGLTLPNAPEHGRKYGGQAFLFDRLADRQAATANGWTVSTTAVAAATARLATVRTVAATEESGTLAGSHAGDLCLFFTLAGTATMTSGERSVDVATNDSVTIPRGGSWEVIRPSADFEMLHIQVGEVS